MRRERTTRLSRYTWARMRRKVDDGQEGREEFRRQRSGERNGNGRGEEKLVTLLQDFCSRRCHCQEIERWRGREGGRKGKGSELERASKHLLSNPALLRRRVFFGRSDLSPPCPPSTGELPPEIQFRKFLCATVSSPRGPRGHAKPDHGCACPSMSPLLTEEWGSGINGTEGYGEQRLLRKIVT